jgi:nucleotide-binding universal stress UspA family protein
MTIVVVGVDASERSRDAIAFCRLLAAASGASLVVANAFPYEDAPSRVSSLPFRQELEDDALQTVERMGAELGELGEGRVRTAVIARTSPAHGLHDIAEREHADLIVVGSSHVGNVRRVMAGSTAERLLHGASCPVVVVPKGYGDTPHAFRRIGVAYDASPEAEAALQAGAAVARATATDLRVIRVLDTLGYASPAMLAGAAYPPFREETERWLQEGLAEALKRLPEDVSADSVLLAGDPAPELAEHSSELDLLIAGSRGYGALRAVLVGGVSGRLVRLAACPVVVIPRGVEAPFGRLFAETAHAPA